MLDTKSPRRGAFNYLLRDPVPDHIPPNDPPPRKPRGVSVIPPTPTRTGGDPHRVHLIIELPPPPKAKPRMGLFGAAIFLLILATLALGGL